MKDIQGKIINMIYLVGNVVFPVFEVEPPAAADFAGALATILSSVVVLWRSLANCALAVFSASSAAKSDLRVSSSSSRVRDKSDLKDSISAS